MDPSAASRWPRAVVAALLWAGAVLVALSGLLLGLRWSHTLDSVHPLVGPAAHRIELAPDTYWIYQDPGGDTIFPFRPGAIHVAGTAGPLAVHAVSSGVQPGTAASPFLGTGLFAPVASFEVARAGGYTISIPRLPANDKLFVGPTYGAALTAVVPWVAGCLVGLVLIVLGLLARRANRRALARNPGQQADGSVPPGTKA